MQIVVEKVSSCSEELKSILRFKNSMEVCEDILASMFKSLVRVWRHRRGVTVGDGWYLLARWILEG
jgi:hypothetical protein